MSLHCGDGQRLWELPAAELTGKPPPVPVEEPVRSGEPEIVAAQYNSGAAMAPVPAGRVRFRVASADYQIGPRS